MVASCIIGLILIKGKIGEYRENDVQPETSSVGNSFD